ncbi:MAG: hypothetical protein JWQ19_590 [Subtercola sp.]|nr:hypothetical protein [Subtercola sp.]
MPESNDIHSKSALTAPRLKLRHSPSVSAPTDGDIDRARIELSQFVIEQANSTARDLGFEWIATSAAPHTYRALYGAYVDSVVYQTPLPISDQHMERMIFVSDEATIAMRFWHAVSHVRHQHNCYSVPAEIELGLWHVAVAEISAISLLAVQLLEADLVGQTLLRAATKQRAIDVRAFDTDVVTYGIAEAICQEVERRG